ncbi:hypothetical protein GLOIN_2v1762929 [Rhizophagus irregularis DAOM 181602=DAOM 197198]|uniref:Serine-enriched protein n=1 Tax=Rhizophagus irregularis (strain DAOM 181602 / DAOM 197198 / MUCL 43194) TaxID=747089 RepID=A0A2P4QVL5_RHIID|nr:hypothetical protein GLOIN_2v1762929 [Rhizophagus irregularis DAOM 181602=DAOM 197198]POG81691.1 hypothetical protein GLOIN_2v1762929 [Rhizophagus irregularis DAOM 181602=DAOM 197198]|eukprot:XP_025188557.1 hypothetical protein GLOIN_2v1762929 [Rhizophagus irregularis DAOM 181602=DAOM 197198]
MASNFHFRLSEDLSLILDDADDYNVIIQVGENQNTKEFRAHSVILRARSPYFKVALSTNWITKKDNMIMFNKPNITPTVFHMILKYIYTGELDLTKQSGENILGLLVASDELLLEELFKHVRDYLIEKQTKWVDKNFVLVLNAVFRLDNCKKLQDYCFKSICENPLPFFSSKIFPSLNKEILFDLLERDDLQIKEVIVWDYLIKWGIEQTSGLGNENSDRAKWNNKDYEELKKTLNQIIPLIRFTEISRADFFDKVRPYRIIIPNHIYEEIEEFYYKDALPKTTILPPRTGYSFEIGKIESNIIKPILAKLIVNWIGNDQLYRFKLIYRGSRDGISNKSFREKCKGRVASLVLIKVKDTNKVFGGYSSIGFCSLGNDFTLINSDDYHDFRFYNSSDNFIFSFENSEDTRHMKISRVVNKSQAILDIDRSGFNFGWGSLSMNNINLHANNHSNNYENNLKTDTVYTIKEIEIFNISNQ